MTGVRVTSQTQAEILDRLKKKSPNNNRHESGNSDMGPGESSLCRRVLYPQACRLKTREQGYRKLLLSLTTSEEPHKANQNLSSPFFFSLEVFDVKRKKKEGKRKKKRREKERKWGGGSPQKTYCILSLELINKVL